MCLKKISIIDSAHQLDKSPQEYLLPKNSNSSCVNVFFIISFSLCSCSFVIIVEDKQAPTPICQDIEVYLDESCEVSITADSIDAGSFDNCLVDTLLISEDGVTFTDIIEGDTALIKL